jgi:hypothetical protein
MRTTAAVTHPRKSSRTSPAGLASAAKHPPYIVGFYLLPDFPMMAFASAIEPLRAANRLSGTKLFDWQLLSRDGEPVRASNGIDIAVHGSIGDGTSLALLLVCAGVHEPRLQDPVVHKWLRNLARFDVAIGGISLGAYMPAYAGLLDGAARFTGKAWPRLPSGFRVFAPQPKFSLSTAIAAPAPVAPLRST